MKDKLLHAAFWLLLIGALIWLMLTTEWVDAQRPTPAHGEAATNPLYATQALLRELGATVARRQSLSWMPPPKGRLVLVSRHWDLFPDRAERLRDWIEQGGHLIIPGSLVELESLSDWLALDRKPLPPPDKVAATKKKSRIPPTRDHCVPLKQSPHAPERYFGTRQLRACGSGPNATYAPAADDDDEPLWSLDGSAGAEMLRMPFGHGTVTVVGDWSVLRNDHVLQGDNPLIMVAALQAVRGADLVFVTEESREPFMGWLWRRGWVAIVLALLALATALWRAAVRFGPLAQPAASGRRSIAKQVRGTAAFLRRHGGQSLHAAQLRALSEAAARRLHRAERTPTEYAKAIGATTDLDAAALATALTIRDPASRPIWRPT